MTQSVDVTAPTAEDPAEVQDPRPPLSANRDFRLLWGGQTVSMIGSEVTEVAFPLLAILALNATPGQLGLISAARTLPALVVTLFAGLLVDRMRRRRAMLVANLARAVIVGTVVVLGWTDGLSIPALCILGFALGGFGIFFDIADHAILPTLVRSGDLGKANSRLEASLNVARIGGPGLAGVLVSLIRAPGALAVDALSYVFSAATLGLMRTPEPTPRAPEQPRGRVWSDIGAGLRFSFGNRNLRALTLEAGVFNFGIQIFLTLFLFYGTRDAHLSAAELGLAMAVGSLGGLAGALAMPKVVERLGLGRALVASVVVAGLGPVGTPLFTRPAGLVIPMIMVSFFVTLFGVVLSSICAAVLRQCLTPNEMMGRAVASERFVTGGVLPIAAVVAGVLGELIGVRGTLFVSACLLPLSLLPVLLSPLRRLATPEDAFAAQAADGETSAANPGEAGA
jgi:MFS family permease